MADSSSDPSLWSFVGPTIQAGAGIYGALSGANTISGAYNNNAAGITTGALNTSEGALSPYASAGVPAVNALSSLYGLNGGTPNYSAFYNQPGYQFSLNQGNQAIQRAANATGGGFSSTTLAQLGNYDAGLASTQYNNYVNQLYGLAQLGLGGATSMGGQAITGAGQVGQNYIGSGIAQGVGTTTAAGQVATLAGKLPWGQIGNGVSSLFGSNSNLSGVSPSLNSSNYATPGYDSTAGVDPSDPSTYYNYDGSDLSGVASIYG